MTAVALAALALLAAEHGAAVALIKTGHLTIRKPPQRRAHNQEGPTQ